MEVGESGNVCVKDLVVVVEGELGYSEMVRGAGVMKTRMGKWPF